MPAFGLVDYCRVSCDVSLDWNDVWYMRLFHRERVSTKQAINNTVFRRQLNGRAYGSDPDVFFLREENCKLTAEQKRTLATLNALLGNVFLTSDMPSRYTQAQRAEYRRLRTLFERATQVQAEMENGRLYIRYLLGGTPQNFVSTRFDSANKPQSNNNTRPYTVLCTRYMGGCFAVLPVGSLRRVFHADGHVIFKVR